MKRNLLEPVGLVAPILVHRFAPIKRAPTKTRRIRLNLTDEDKAFLDALTAAHKTPSSAIISDLFAEWCRCIRSGRDASGRPIDWKLSEPVPKKVEDLVSQAREIIRKRI